jgi:hypothetical protein
MYMGVPIKAPVRVSGVDSGVSKAPARRGACSVASGSFVSLAP